MKQPLPDEMGVPNSDEALVAEYLRGNPNALGDLFIRHAPAVRRLTVSIMGPTQDLDDLVQNVFLNVHRSLHRFRGSARFTTWLHRITVNTALSALRKPKRHVPYPPEAFTQAKDPKNGIEETLVVHEMMCRLFKILDTLTPKRRIAFTLFAVEGLSLKEICDLTGAPSAVVKSRIFFARKEVFQKAGSDPCLSPLLDELRA